KEELCFVETNGRARVYNLITNQFLPGTAKFPMNAENIISTPDGSCIVAFVKGITSDKNIDHLSNNEDNLSEDGSNEVDPNDYDVNKSDVDENDAAQDIGKDIVIEDASDNDATEDTREDEASKDDVSKDDVSKDDVSKDDVSKDDVSKDDVSKDDVSNDVSKDDSEEYITKVEQIIERSMDHAYIYFCTSFGKPASKVISIPPILSSLESIQFSSIRNLQIHLSTIDLNSSTFRSMIVKITQEKTQYCFQQKFKKRSLGMVKVVSQNQEYSLLEGKDTLFKRDIKEGENLVIMGEKRPVIRIASDTQLKISGSFQNIIGFNSWMEFRVEPKTMLNGFIDAYKLMFEKYPIDNFIDPDQNSTLSLQIVLDVDDDNIIQDYEHKFKDYIFKTFEELTVSTKKPATSLKRFNTSVTSFENLNLESLKEDSDRVQFGSWVIQLCVLIPIQIAVARNNIFQPLKDGLSAFDAESTESEALYVDEIAQRISFGWYEGIFKYFGDLPVKVVSSMGEQYMLNHLVGTTFDGSAMRCTEGVWMSLGNDSILLCQVRSAAILQVNRY
ncbi:7363_t:CDS:2, partial [Dentiscutata heterogama]